MNLLLDGRSLADSFALKRNSIGFLRLFLATLVIVHHSFTLRHEWSRDPLWQLTKQLDLGSLAVQAFLVLSGFLIGASFEKTNSLPRYLWHRALRLYPGYWVCLLVSVLVLAPLAWFIERGTFAGYFAGSGTSAFNYFTANMTLWIRQTEIAGLFQSHSSRYFNGSLWTLSLEATCYLLLPLAAYAGGLRKARLLLLLAWIALVVWFALDASGMVGLRMFSLMKAGIYFATGTLIYAFRDVVRLNLKLVLAFLGLLVLAVALNFAIVASLIAVPYLVLFSAFKLPFVDWERRADLSYGTYVYAYPIQQILISLWPEIHSLGLLVLAMLIVAPVAFLSWRFVERPALRLKNADLPLFRSRELRVTPAD